MLVDPTEVGEAKKSSEIFKQLSDPKVYASVVGACIFISITCRPDITQAVGRVSRAMHAPTDMHIAQVMTLMGYLRLTQNHKLTYTANSPVVDNLREHATKDNI